MTEIVDSLLKLIKIVSFWAMIMIWISFDMERLGQWNYYSNVWKFGKLISKKYEFIGCFAEIFAVVNLWYYYFWSMHVNTIILVFLYPVMSLQ